jgi:hypothetical protein
MNRVPADYSVTPRDVQSIWILVITHISETVIASVFREAVSCFGVDCFAAKTLLAVTFGLVSNHQIMLSLLREQRPAKCQDPSQPGARI